MPFQSFAEHRTKARFGPVMSIASMRRGQGVPPPRRSVCAQRVYPRVHQWVTSIGLEPSAHGTHSMRRTKAALIYRKTGNLRAVQLLLGHTKMDSTVRYLGVELEDALSIAESIEL